MLPHNQQQIARIRQSEFLQEANDNRQLEQRIRHFLKRIGHVPLAAIDRISKNFQAAVGNVLQKHDPISTD